MHALLPRTLLLLTIPFFTGLVLHVDEPPLLTVVDQQGDAHPIGAEAWNKFERKSVKVRTESGADVEFSGVLLIDVLKASGAWIEEPMRGRRLASYALAEAGDNYRVLFSLVEIDPAFTDKVILVADRRDGKPLPESEGPLRLIVPDETKQARWIRMLKSISLNQLPSP